jgi:DNA polymerase
MIDYFPDDEIYLIHVNIRMFAEPWFDVDETMVQEEIDDQVRIKTEKFKASKLPKSVLSSNQQFGVYLETQGFDLPTKENAKGDLIPALGQKDWPYLKFITAHPELNHVWEGRKYAKSAIQESRARWFQAVSQFTGGKMPVPLNYYGAHTGRYSGGEKLNLQNLPRIGGEGTGRLRRALRAPDGHQVIVSDLSNIEARVLAWVSGQDYLLDMYREGGDPYLYMASKIYDFDYDETMIRRTDKSHPNYNPSYRKFERNVGKVSVLGLGYGMGANKFWVTMNTGPMGMDPIPMSFEEASSIVETYRTTNFAVVDYWRTCDAWIPQMIQGANDVTFGPLDVVGTNLVMPNGMALQYPNLRAVPDARGHSMQYSPELLPNGELKIRKFLWGGTLTENIVQALARIVITEQTIKIERWLDKTYGLDVSRTCHMVHDELIVIAPDGHAQTVFDKMVEIMGQPPEWAPDLPLECDGGFDENYIK